MRFTIQVLTMSFADIANVTKNLDVDNLKHNVDEMLFIICLTKLHKGEQLRKRELASHLIHDKPLEQSLKNTM